MNAQLREIQNARLAYQPAAEFLEQAKRSAETWQMLVAEHQKGNVPPQSVYSLAGRFEQLPTMPTEAQMLDEADDRATYLDMQRWLRSQIRFREGNLWIELEPGYNHLWKKFSPAQLEQMKVFLISLKEKLYGKTFAELNGWNPDPVHFASPLKTFDEGMIFVYPSAADSAGWPAHPIIRLWVGHPYDEDAWLA